MGVNALEGSGVHAAQLVLAARRTPRRPRSWGSRFCHVSSITSRTQLRLCTKQKEASATRRVIDRWAFSLRPRPRALQIGVASE